MSLAGLHYMLEEAGIHASTYYIKTIYCRQNGKILPSCEGHHEVFPQEGADDELIGSVCLEYTDCYENYGSAQLGVKDG